MLKQGRFILILLVIVLSGCLGGVWTGANMAYDRHNVYKKLNDFNLSTEINKTLGHDKRFVQPNCVLDIGVFHGDVLIAGHVPNPELLTELQNRMSRIEGHRRLFIQVQVSNTPSNSLEDSWITTKIRSQIFADDSVDPNAFKVITSDGIVYLMGDVLLDEAHKVVRIARQTSGVVHVVKLLKYYTYQSPKINVA